LREQLQQEEEALMPLVPLDSMRLIFYQDSTYKLIRYNVVPNNIHGPAVVEAGRWELDPDTGYLTVQVERVDGLSILSAPLPRWEIRKVANKQLVLRQYGMGEQYLIFGRKE